MEAEDEDQASTTLTDFIVIVVKCFVVGCAGLFALGVLTWIVEAGQ